jgi:hypothetical protein
VRKLAATLAAVAAVSAGSIATSGVVQADPCRGPACGVGPGIGPVVGPAGPVGVGGLGPVAGPVGPVGVGGVVGPVGVNPVAVAYAIPNGYPLWPEYPGEVPCYTPAGVAYYTPGADPCLCFSTDTGAVIPC